MDKKQMENWVRRNCKFAQSEESVPMKIDPDFNPAWADDAAYMAAGQPDGIDVTVFYSDEQIPYSKQTLESPGQDAGFDVRVTKVLMADGTDILPYILSKDPRYFERFEEKKAEEMKGTAIDNAAADDAWRAER
jgi:hypothetical protein